MDAVSLLTTQLAEVAYQLEHAIKGATLETLNAKPLPEGMSIREQVLHLRECYQAAITSAAGGNHEWGSFTVPEFPESELVSAALAHRAEAVAKVIESGKLEFATNYILLHDAYHVGQIVANRLAVEPDWDSYVIYNH